MPLLTYVQVTPSSDSTINMSDARFVSLKTDPRFRRPKKHHSKVILDDRFKDLLGDENKSKKKKKKSTKETTGACTPYNFPSTAR